MAESMVGLNREHTDVQKLSSADIGENSYSYGLGC